MLDSIMRMNHPHNYSCVYTVNMVSKIEVGLISTMGLF